VTTTDRHGAIHDYRARKIVVATGYYDLTNQLNIPGEELEKVFHYYKEAHPYYDTDVVVIGGKNSAAEAALDLWRHGARVTLIHRGAQMHNHDQILGAARHREPHQSRGNRSAFQQHRPRDWAGLGGGDDAGGPAPREK
jgi:thioredoxin reductase